MCANIYAVFPSGVFVQKEQEPPMSSIRSRPANVNKFNCKKNLIWRGCWRTGLWRLTVPGEQRFLEIVFYAINLWLKSLQAARSSRATLHDDD